MEIVGFTSEWAPFCSPSSQHEGKTCAIQKGKGWRRGMSDFKHWWWLAVFVMLHCRCASSPFTKRKGFKIPLPSFSTFFPPPVSDWRMHGQVEFSYIPPTAKILLYGLFLTLRRLYWINWCRAGGNKPNRSLLRKILLFIALTF